jgi:hypothetical protein
VDGTGIGLRSEELPSPDRMANRVSPKLSCFPVTRDFMAGFRPRFRRSQALHSSSVGWSAGADPPPPRQVSLREPPSTVSGSVKQVVALLAGAFAPHLTRRRRPGVGHSGIDEASSLLFGEERQRSSFRSTMAEYCRSGPSTANSQEDT